MILRGSQSHNVVYTLIVDRETPKVRLMMPPQKLHRRLPKFKLLNLPTRRLRKRIRRLEEEYVLWHCPSVSNPTQANPRTREKRERHTKM